MPPPCGAPRAAGPGSRWAGPARPPNSPPSREASPRLQGPRRQRTWTLGWRRRPGPCPSGRGGRWRRRGRFSSCEASSRRQCSGRRRRSGGQRRRSGGQRRRSGTGTSSGCRPANPSRRRARRGSSRKSRRKGGGQGRGWGPVRGTLWQGARPRRPRQRRRRGSSQQWLPPRTCCLPRRTGRPSSRWCRGFKLPWTAMTLSRGGNRGTPWWRPPLPRLPAPPPPQPSQPPAAHESGASTGTVSP